MFPDANGVPGNHARQFRVTNIGQELKQALFLAGLGGTQNLLPS
jgi:hypothetical protein